MSGSRENKPFERFKHDLRQLFKSNKSGSGNHQIKLNDEYVLTAEMEHQLSNRVPIATRVKTMTELSEIVHRSKLEEHAIEKICGCVNDIFYDTHSRDAQHVVIEFYQFLVQGQFDRLGAMRSYFFDIIKNHEIGEDPIPRFELFQKLTDNGKNISTFEEEIGFFLLDWMPSIVAAGKTVDFLSVLVNYMKYNASFIDEEIINGIVTCVCFLCCQSDNKDIVCGSLNVLDAVVCYCQLSQQTMIVFVRALSRTICLEDYNTYSWKIMRNLLGSFLGQLCFQTICSLLLEDKNYDDTGSICGAIFILNMALLSGKPDFIVGYIPSLIIPSILKASKTKDAVVLVEVCLCVKWLVEKYGEELKEHCWDSIFVILESVLCKMENSDRFQSQNYISDVFMKMESLLKRKQCKADIERLYEFSHKWHNKMPEPLIFYLTDRFFSRLLLIEPHWTKTVHLFVSTFLNVETRTTIREYVLKSFVKVIQDNICHHEDEIINDIVKPYLSNFAFEKNDTIRNLTLKFLIEFCHSCRGDNMESVFDILKQVLRNPFKQPDMVILNDSETSSLKLVVRGLLDLFIFSIYELPSSNAVKILDILVSFLESHYEKPYILDSVIDIRWMIIDCIVKLRADAMCRIGYVGDSANVKYSSYLLVNYSRSSNSCTSAFTSRVNSKSSEESCSSFEEEIHADYVLTYISLTNACRVIVTALKKESDWAFLESILKAIPVALRNRALVFSKYNSEVETIVSASISMIYDGTASDRLTLKNTPPKFNKSDFYSYVVPVLSAFASYHTHIELDQQQRLITCLECGLVSKSAPQCVSALMICLLEMKEAMVKLLPEILLNLSKISATKHVAIPILEFLSLLTTFPQVFVNFNSNQCMTVFAIILPYTNAFKYHHYIVSLAHHLIAVWFLKCRKPLRRGYVEYITKGLNSSVSFEDVHFPKPIIQNEDSSNRKRSSSLTEQGNRRQERRLMSGSGRLMPSNSGTGVGDLRKSIDETLIMFHRELTETCVDLMARVTFINCSALPRRHPGSEFILRNGQSNTWLLGNTLITITTSACTQKPMNNGYCDKCYSSCFIVKSLQQFDSSIEGKLADDKNTDGIPEPKIKQLTRHLSINSEDGSLEGLKFSSDTNSEFSDRRLTDSLTNIAKDDRASNDCCPCWCQGWAEVHIRRPTGDIAWIMRLQNETFFSPSNNPFADISTLYQASVIQEGFQMSDKYKKMDKDDVDKNLCSSASGQDELLKLNSPNQSQSSVVCDETMTPTELKTDKIESNDPEQDDTVLEEDLDDQCCQARNPVRRSNSSPEMSANWKNTFAKDSSRSFNSSPVNADQSETGDQCSLMECKKLGKHKELRCNCEAIPEEFPGLGTTPPKPIVDKNVDIYQPENLSDIESKAYSPSPSVSSVSHSLSHSNPLLPPSSSCENVDFEKKKSETKFFDEQCLPNDDFEFNRSASISQVTPSSKKYLPTASHVNLTHSLTSSQPHLTAKPPLSPPTYSLRSLNKHGKDYSSADSQSDSFQNINQDYKRDRGYTISVMSPTKRSQFDRESKNKFFDQRKNESKRSGINPSFVFLQLYDTSRWSNPMEKPILIPLTNTLQRAIDVFDRIPPYETHKVGVIYVGPGQVNNEIEILRNSNGSLRYVDFLSKLGTMVKLAEVNPQDVYLGGLERNGSDGKYAYIWKDDIMQVIFHVATLMPNKSYDTNSSDKKKHIGNDYVIIVYNESGKEYDLRTVKCQFNFACIVVEPLDHGNNQLTVKAREDLLELIGNVEIKIVSDKNVSLLARQLALHINLASLVLCSMNKDRNHGGIYASNWLERLRKIKQFRKKVIDELKLSNPGNDDVAASKQSSRRNYVYDFIDYT